MLAHGVEGGGENSVRRHDLGEAYKGLRPVAWGQRAQEKFPESNKE